MKIAQISLAAILGATLLAGGAFAQTPSGDARRGARLFGTCAACHSLAPGRNMTGPSLAGVWQRKAGTLAGFDRYSKEIKQSGVTWNAKTLDEWLKNPAKLVPGNSMTFPGIGEPKARADLVAFLKGGGQMPAMASQSGGMGGMMGGMMGGAASFQDLKKVGPGNRVTAIRMCRDSYFVSKADGKVSAFWEPNLRFETDGSSLGPPSGKPAIMPAGMMGDRSAVIFAAPEEISRFIKHQC